MLFSLIASTLAGSQSQVITTYPCQRLGWAWRNVWVTCSIDARIPGATGVPTVPLTTSDGNAPNYNAGFNYVGTSPFTGTSIDIAPNQNAATVNGVFTTALFGPAASFLDANYGMKAFWADNARSQALCAVMGTAPSGITGIRTACRRSIDLYGSLLELCRNPVRARTPLAAPGAGPSGAPHQNAFYGAQHLWNAAAPLAEMTPHAGNVQILNHFASQCVSPAQKILGPVNSCPGLTGWFSVASQACNVANAFGVGGTLVTTPANIAKVPAVVATGGLFGGAANAPLNPAFVCGTTVDASNWFPAGPSFHRSACRRALDQFTRTAARCAAQSASFEPAQATLQKLGVHWGQIAPEDCK